MLYYKISSKIISHYSFLTANIALCTDCARQPYRAGCWKNHLASLRYFFRQALHRSLAKNSRASKKLKYWLHGAGHV